jgi:capsular polysaccharide biosynthesis protein
MKKLIVSICVVAALTIAAAAYLFATTPREYEAASNIVFVNDDGSAQIKVDSINKVIQTHEDVEIDGRVLRAGTIIVPGSGDEIYYNYPRKDAVKGDN